MQAHNLDTGDILKHGLQGRPSRLHQLGPHLLEQIPALVGMERLDQLLFGRRQDAAEAHHEKIANEVGVDLLGAAAHVLLFEAADPFADCGLDLALCLHGHRECTAIRDPTARQTTSAML